MTSELVWRGRREAFLLTVVSSSRSERSSVTPEGTLSADRTIVAQSFWDTLASEYPSEPEKVQLVARLPLACDRSGAGVGRGAGAAKAEAARQAARRVDRKNTIVIKQREDAAMLEQLPPPPWHLGVSGRVYILGSGAAACLAAVSCANRAKYSIVVSISPKAHDTVGGSPPLNCLIRAAPPPVTIRGPWHLVKVLQ